MGDLIEFVYPGTGPSFWGIYVGDGHAIHFGVGGVQLNWQLYCIYIWSLILVSVGFGWRVMLLIKTGTDYTEMKYLELQKYM